jgi:hypothetical protein
MTKFFLHISWMIFLLAGFQFAISQSPPSVKATVDRQDILIGEPIHLVLEAQIPLGTQMSWYADSIPHFEYLEKGSLDSSISNDGKTYRQNLVITSFDSGSWFIPRLAFISNQEKFFTDSIPVNVNFSKFDPSKDYHDIKDILELENPDTRYIPWFLGGITLLSWGLFIFFLTRKKRPEPVSRQPVSRASPYEEAILALDALEKRRLPESGQTKLYYAELNDILRLFVFRKMHLVTMEKTNEELILQFRDLNLKQEDFSRLAQALRIVDFVKFAKYLPEPADNRTNYEIIRSSIEHLNEFPK